MNYWVLAWLILHSHCQKSPSSRAANSHQASFRRTLLPCSYTHPRPPFSSSVCTLWDVQLISDGPPAGPTFPSSSDSLKPRSLPLWTRWCLCVSLQENKAHTHTHTCPPQTFPDISSSFRLLPHLFPFLMLKPTGQGANSNDAAAHQVFAPAALQEQNRAAFFFAEYQFKKMRPWIIDNRYQYVNEYPAVQCLWAYTSRGKSVPGNRLGKVPRKEKEKFNICAHAPADISL